MLTDPRGRSSFVVVQAAPSQWRATGVATGPETWLPIAHTSSGPGATAASKIVPTLSGDVPSDGVRVHDPTSPVANDPAVETATTPNAAATAMNMRIEGAVIGSP